MPRLPTSLGGYSLLLPALWTLLARARSAAEAPTSTHRTSIFGSADCAEHASCASCTQEPAWLMPCRWCPTDQRCHATGSWDNPCGANTSVTNVSSCPAPAPPQTTFSLQEAYDMILHADAVYFDDPLAQRVLPPSFKLVVSTKYSLGTWNDAFAYLGIDTNSSRIIAAFRGTTTFTQLAEELLHHALVNVSWGPDPGILVNEYFATAVDSVINMTKLHDALEDQLKACPACEIFFTGHSLGGAMAMITAYRVAQRLERAPVVYTFGQPRTGNAAFSRLVDRQLPRIFRLANAVDPVPHVPLCDKENLTCMETPSGYYHAGVELWFPSGDYKNGAMCGYRECTGRPFHEDYSCSDGVVSSTEPPNPSDHNGYFITMPHGFCLGQTKPNVSESHSLGGRHRGTTELLV